MKHKTRGQNASPRAHVRIGNDGVTASLAALSLHDRWRKVIAAYLSEGPTGCEAPCGPYRAFRWP
jgi:hypothetical protein